VRQIEKQDIYSSPIIDGVLVATSHASKKSIGLTADTRVKTFQGPHKD
jgi:uncharacterized linocin/CFP29 family protein